MKAVVAAFVDSLFPLTVGKKYILHHFKANKLNSTNHFQIKVVCKFIVCSIFLLLGNSFDFNYRFSAPITCLFRFNPNVLDDINSIEVIRLTKQN